MMKIKFLLILLFAALSTRAQILKHDQHRYNEFSFFVDQLYLGQEAGNGGDHKVFGDETMWFHEGKIKTINACIEKTRDFSSLLSRESIHSIITEAYHQWENYLNLKNKPVLRFHHQCSGKEDLSIFLGTNNKRVLGVKTKYQNPIAFAELEQFDLGNKVGKGIIWVTSQYKLFPNSKFPYWGRDSFKAVMLHELGHVFGQRHKEQTIMTGDLVKFLYYGGHWGARSSLEWENNKGLIRHYFNSIDHTRSVKSCIYSCGKDQIKGVFHNNRFKLLVGRDSVGTVKSKIMRDRTNHTFKLVVEDSRDRKTFDLRIDHANTLELNDVSIATGTIESYDGEKIPFRLTFNLPANSSNYWHIQKIATGIKLEILRFNKRFNFHRYEEVFQSAKKYNRL